MFFGWLSIIFLLLVLIRWKSWTPVDVHFCLRNLCVCVCVCVLSACRLPQGVPQAQAQALHALVQQLKKNGEDYQSNDCEDNPNYVSPPQAFLIAAGPGEVTMHLQPSQPVFPT